MMFQPQQHLRARIPPVQEYVMAVSIRGLMNRSIAGVLAVGLAILLTFEASGADDVLAGFFQFAGPLGPLSAPQLRIALEHAAGQENGLLPQISGRSWRIVEYRHHVAGLENRPDTAADGLERLG